MFPAANGAIERASEQDRARTVRRAFVVIGRGQAREERETGEIVHAGICIQTSPRVCVPINYTVQPMSRYLPTVFLSVCTRACTRTCVCVRDAALSSRAPLLLFTRARRTRISREAHTENGSAKLSYHGHGGQRARSVSPLSRTDRCRPTTMSYRRSVSNAHTSACRACRLISPAEIREVTTSLVRACTHTHIRARAQCARKKFLRNNSTRIN